MTGRRPRAMIADDEPLLRRELERLLANAWPELEVVASVRNGREAIERFEALRPDICFLDVRMPGLSGVEVADRIGAETHIVFITAYDQYAVRAFAQGAVDYLVKPVEPERLAETVARIQRRMDTAGHARAPIAPETIRELAALMGRSEQPEFLRWIHAQAGSTVRLIPVEEIQYLRSDTKYTRVTWREHGGKPAHALVRTTLKDLVTRLDPGRFAQIHRSVVVNLAAVSHVVHRDNETARLHLRDSDEVLPVSRSYIHRFRQM